MKHPLMEEDRRSKVEESGRNLARSSGPSRSWQSSVRAALAVTACTYNLAHLTINVTMILRPRPRSR